MRLHSNLPLTLLIAFGLSLPAFAAKKDKTKGLPEATNTVPEGSSNRSRTTRKS